MKPSNRVINLLSLQLASLGLALSMVPAVADDAVPRSAISKNSDMSRMSGMNCSAVPASPTKVLLPLGKSTMLRLPGPVSNRTLGNPKHLGRCGHPCYDELNSPNFCSEFRIK